MKLLNLVDLQIPSLMQGSIIVPFVDYLNDGNNAFNYPLNYYIGGTNGNDIAAIVPCTFHIHTFNTMVCDLLSM